MSLAKQNMVLVYKSRQKQVNLYLRTIQSHVAFSTIKTCKFKEQNFF